MVPLGSDNGIGADERMAALRHHAPPGVSIRLVLVAPCLAAAAAAGRGEVGGLHWPARKGVDSHLMANASSAPHKQSVTMAAKAAEATASGTSPGHKDNPSDEILNPKIPNLNPKTQTLNLKTLNPDP